MVLNRGRCTEGEKHTRVLCVLAETRAPKDSGKTIIHRMHIMIS